MKKTFKFFGKLNCTILDGIKEKNETYIFFSTCQLFPIVCGKHALNREDGLKGNVSVGLQRLTQVQIEVHIIRGG